MIKLTQAQFEEIKRLQEPEIFTEAQMNSWVESLKDTLIKAEVDELDEVEKATVNEFNHEFMSFVKVQVISSPTEADLNKSLKYDNFFMREKQVAWTEEEITKSIDGEDKSEKVRTGIYLDTKVNQVLNRVGLQFGRSIEEQVEKSEEDELEKGGEGSKGGKVIGHTKSGKPIYESDNKKNIRGDHDKIVDKIDAFRRQLNDKEISAEDKVKIRAEHDKLIDKLSEKRRALNTKED